MKPGVDVFVVYKSKILFIFRDDLPNIPYPNTWNLPGGGIEEGELALDAAKRELFEETNLLEKSLEFINNREYPDGNNVHYFIVEINDKEKAEIKLGNEGQKIDFFSLEEALTINIFPNLKTYLQENQDLLKQLISGSD